MRRNNALILVLNLLMVAGWSYPSHGMACSKPETPVQIHIKREVRQVTIDHRLDRAALQRLPNDTISPYGDHYQTHINGLMRGTIGMTTKTSLAWESDKKRDMNCLRYHRIDVTLSFDPIIHIARDIPKNSCLYQAVLEHERKHLDVDLQIIRDYEVQLTSQLNQYLNSNHVQNIAPIRQAALSSAKQLMMKEIESIIQRIHQSLQLERKNRQQAIDTLEEYQRVAALCPNDKQF